MDSKKVTLVVLLDLSKASDSIDHCRLIRKLRGLGLSEPAVQWFKSYLSDRKQYVRIGSKYSSLCKINNGVPQGSILGPLLFNIYIDELPSIPENCSMESHVDDSKLLTFNINLLLTFDINLSFPIASAGTAALQISEDQGNVAAWCCHNSLLINPDKTN